MADEQVSGPWEKFSQAQPAAVKEVPSGAAHPAQKFKSIGAPQEQPKLVKEEKVLASVEKATPDARALRAAEVEQVKVDEGVVLNEVGRNISYFDSAKPPRLTGGSGHLMTSSEIAKYPEGTEIPDKVVEAWHQEDVEEAQDDVDMLIKKNGLDIDPEAEKILFNMVFNMGRTKLAKFKDMIGHLKNKEYGLAADEMVDSDWFGQVGDRATRLEKRMRAIK